MRKKGLLLCLIGGFSRSANKIFDLLRCYEVYAGS